VPDFGVLDELNRDLWRPFAQAYAQRDAAAFARLHAPELIRVEAAGRWAGDLAAYLDRITAFFDKVTGRGGTIAITFRFVERVVDGPIASERGVYRIDRAVPGETARVYYGRFHVFARKSGDRWRIVVDYDTTDAGAVNEDTFAAAHDLDDFAALDATTG
jgi:ketosteroid isomerase-like protein